MAGIPHIVVGLSLFLWISWV